MAWDPAFDIAFNPASIAVLGASTKRRGGGNGFIRGMQEMGYAGRVYPVNPRAGEIMGYTCYPSLAAVPEVPDLVIVAVGAARAADALEECAAKGARNVHMFTAGFEETGDASGVELADRLREIARRGRLNIVGPNCMGIYSARGRISAWGKLPTEPGPVSMISQSGALGGEFSRLAADLRLLMNKVISYGNGYVLDSTDFLEHFESDPDTRFIAMYLEGVRDGAKLLRMVRRIAPVKPVVVLKGGLTDAGSRAVASHTGSLAGQSAVWSGFFAQSGAIRVDSIEEMTDVLQLLVRLPAFAGRGVALMGGAGGNSVAATDICARNGLQVPEISQDVQAKLRTFIGVAGTSVRNPMDVGMQLKGPDDYARVLELVASDPAIDIVVVEVHPMMVRGGSRRRAQRMLESMVEFAAPRRASKPIVVAMRNSGDNLQSERARLRLTRSFLEAGVPVYRSVERACRAIYRATSYYRAQTDLGESAEDDRALT